MLLQKSKGIVKKTPKHRCCFLDTFEDLLRFDCLFFSFKIFLVLFELSSVLKSSTYLSMRSLAAHRISLFLIILCKILFLFYIIFINLKIIYFYVILIKKKKRGIEQSGSSQGS